jgi:hypothetical protein
MRKLYKYIYVISLKKSVNLICENFPKFVFCFAKCFNFTLYPDIDELQYNLNRTSDVLLSDFSEDKLTEIMTHLVLRR